MEERAEVSEGSGTEVIGEDIVKNVVGEPDVTLGEKRDHWATDA